MTLITDIETIKTERNNFLNDFDLKSDLIHILKKASKNNNLNSIRVHKYLTSTGLVGKVITARFLESIQLSEKTTINQLSDKNINDIATFLKQI
jgi:ribosomal protein S13